MNCILPILLDEYNDILDVAEAIFGRGSYDGAGEDEKGVSKRNHFELIGGCSRTSKRIAFIMLWQRARV